MKRSSLVIVIVSALVIIGIVFYLAKPRADETDNSQPRAVTPVDPAAAGPPATLVSCTGPISGQVSIASLDARHKWAQSLVKTNHADNALTELRNIETADPGYPAINLDISDALLKTKHANEAKDAINLQLSISECLADLPQAEMQNYCKAEWVSDPQGGCAAGLARINQQAHYEAGLVDAGIRDAGAHAAPAAAPAAAPRPRVAAAGSAPTAGGTPAAGAAPAEVAAAPVTTAPPPPAPKPVPINIKSEEASDHVGQLATVCGTVVSKHTAEDSNGKPTFVNLDRSLPQPTFTIVVWGTDSTAVGTLPETGRLCVTGTVAMYRGNPQIVLHDAKNWSQP